MWHTVLIAAHALAGALAWVSGLLAVRDGRLFDVYLWSLIGMAAFLLAAVVGTWARIDATPRAVFAAFAVLSWLMVWLAASARRIRPTGSGSPSERYVDHVGFTLVALFDGFAVIVVLDAGGPMWLVVGTGVAVAIAGHFWIRWAKRTLTARAAGRP